MVCFNAVLCSFHAFLEKNVAPGGYIKKKKIFGHLLSARFLLDDLCQLLVPSIRQWIQFVLNHDLICPWNGKALGFKEK